MSICGLNDSSNTLLLESDNIEFSGNVIAKNIISNLNANNIHVDGNLSLELNYAKLVETLLPNHPLIDMSGAGVRLRINKKGNRLAISGIDFESYNTFKDQDNGKLSDGINNAPRGKVDRGFVKTYELNEDGSILRQYGQDLSENYGFGSWGLDMDEEGNTLVIGMPSKTITEAHASVNNEYTIKSSNLLNLADNKDYQCGQINIYHYNSITDQWNLVNNSPVTTNRSSEIADFYKYSFRGYGNTQHINDFTFQSTGYKGVGDRRLATTEWLHYSMDGIPLIYKFYGSNVKISGNGNKIIVSAPLSWSRSNGGTPVSGSGASAIYSYGTAYFQCGYIEVFEKAINTIEPSWNLVFRYMPHLWPSGAVNINPSYRIGQNYNSGISVADGGIAINNDGSKIAVTGPGRDVTDNESFSDGITLLFIENNTNDIYYDSVNDISYHIIDDVSYNVIYTNYLLKNLISGGSIYNKSGRPHTNWLTSISYVTSWNMNRKYTSYGIQSLSFDYSGNRLITSCYDKNYFDNCGIVEIYDTNTNSLVLNKLMIGNKAEQKGQQATISSNGNRIAVLSANTTAYSKFHIKIYDYINGDWVLNCNIISIDIPSGDLLEIGYLTMSGDGNILIISLRWKTDVNNDNSKIFIYNLSNKKKFNLNGFITNNMNLYDSSSNNY